MPKKYIQYLENPGEESEGVVKKKRAKKGEGKKKKERKTRTVEFTTKDGMHIKFRVNKNATSEQNRGASGRAIQKARCKAAGGRPYHSKGKNAKNGIACAAKEKKSKPYAQRKKVAAKEHRTRFVHLP